MSREVEVQNIQMTATTPENIQISLGQIGTAPGTAATAASGKSLTMSSGVLMETTKDAGASDGKVHAPVNDWDWSNTADISAYYQLGKLIPASSTTGENIYFTPDADGVGKSVTPFTGDSVNNWYGGAKTNDVAVEAAGTLNNYRFDDAIYGPATEYNGSATVVTLAATTGTGYGDAVQAVIRVWLEGEDPDCWNDTAGQNWSINLKFLNGTTSDGKDISGTASLTPPSP